MKKIVLRLFFSLLAVSVMNASANAQAFLIHYWNFNNYTLTGDLWPHILPIKADFSRIDTNKAQIVYTGLPGLSTTSVAYSATTMMDFNTTTDTLNASVNARMGAAIGNSNRCSNPSDSMQLLFYIPSTGYKNLLFKFISYPSSTTSGQKVQLYDYSIDSGVNWITTGLPKTSDTFSAKIWRLNSFTFDPSAYNNSKLVFRVRFAQQNTGSSGNNRFDNVTLDGDTISTTPPPPPTTTLIHYWNFNNFATAYHNPGIPTLKADWSAIDTNKTGLAYKLVPGTSSNYAGYVDNFATGPADSDVYNLRTIGGVLTPAGNVYRFRNPTDSAYLVLYMPSTNYKDLVFSYAVEASSTGSGMHFNNFSYSTDSGASWKTTGLDHTSDSTISIGGYTAVQCVFKLITVKFTSADTTVNNNPRLAFRIIPSFNTDLLSGNNRFDNFTLDGVPEGATNPIKVSSVVSAIATPTLYPNPAGQTIFINTYAEGDKIVTIYNTTGQKVIGAQSGDKVININTASLATGMYYVNIHMQTGEMYNLKFVKN